MIDICDDDKIGVKEGILAKECNLLFEGRQLMDDLTVLNYGLIENNTIHVVLRLR